MNKMQKYFFDDKEISITQLNFLRTLVSKYGNEVTFKDLTLGEKRKFLDLFRGSKFNDKDDNTLFNSLITGKYKIEKEDGTFEFTLT